MSGPKSTKRSPLRWRRRKSSGSRWSAESFELVRDGDWLAIVQKAGSEWFWYSAAVNTANNPTTLEQAKSQAMAAVKAAEADADDIQKGSKP